MPRAYPRRGDVWLLDGGDLALIVSCDDWNRRHINTYLTLDVEPGHTEDAGNYATLIEVDAERFTVYGDQIVGVAPNELRQRQFAVNAEVVAEVNEMLDRAIAPRPRTGYGSPRPPRHPYPGQIRFADLHIEGEREKPVVVVSSEGYAESLSYAQVIVCRKTSNPGRPHDFDVVLSSNTGKVVCSDVRTVRSEDVRERTTQAMAVDGREQEAILEKVRLMLGLP